jgi:hypothetical protein
MSKVLTTDLPPLPQRGQCPEPKYLLDSSERGPLVVMGELLFCRRGRLWQTLRSSAEFQILWAGERGKGTREWTDELLAIVDAI